MIYPSAPAAKMPLFPEGTLFGVSTSAFQIEGAAAEDGKLPSIWDDFSHRKGRIRFGQNADAGCDHYNRIVDDVAIMGRLGIQAYRFSISWPRVIPEGRGAVNLKGLDFYDRLTDELLTAGIRPFATLYHWDFPLALYRRSGGFVSRQSAEDFGDYCEVVVRRLGDRVKDWITLNEPWIHSVMGYLLGVHAPGVMKPLQWPRVVHNQLLAHACAMERIKALYPAARVGISLNLSPAHPARTGSADIRNLPFADDLLNGLFLDPLFKGKYPDSIMRRFGFMWPKVPHADMERISKPVNFLGINTYTRMKARFAPWLPLLSTWFGTGRIPAREYEKNGRSYTSMGWEVYPDALYEILIKIRDGYGNVPVYITENGASYNDKPDGYRIKDKARQDFLQSYTASAAKAAEEGCDLRGYFVWSLMDNFEWTEGFTKRFGLVYVDHKTGRRQIKDSGYWYKDLILANRR